MKREAKTAERGMAMRLLDNHLYTTGPGCPGCENVCNYMVPCNYTQHKTRRVPHVICSPLYGSKWHRSVCSGGSWPWPPLFYLQEFRKPGAKGTCLMAMHCYGILL